MKGTKNCFFFYLLVQMLEDKKENTIQTTIIYSREMKVKQTGEIHDS